MENQDVSTKAPPEKVSYQDCMYYSLRELVERLANEHDGVDLACSGRALWLLNEEAGAKAWRSHANEQPVLQFLRRDGRILKAFFSDRPSIKDGEAILYYRSGKQTLIDYSGVC